MGQKCERVLSGLFEVSLIPSLLRRYGVEVLRSDPMACAIIEANYLWILTECGGPLEY